MTTRIPGSLLVLLLLPAASSRAERETLAQLVAALDERDPGRRFAAQNRLMERGDLEWPRVVPLLDHDSLEVRRAVRLRLRQELRSGPRDARLAIVRALDSVGAARGLLPVLASLARKADPEIAGRAMVAHMRIGAHRDYVANLAASRGTWVFLREFDPERDPALRRTAALLEELRIHADGAAVADVKEYLDLLAAASPDATATLAQRITDATGASLGTWVEIAASHAVLPAAMGPVVAARLREGEAREAKAVASALVAGDPLWGETAAPVRDATLARLERTEPDVRVFLLLLLARCGGDDPRVRTVLARDASAPGANGIAAAALLASLGEAGGDDPVARLRALEPADRLRALARALELGTAEFIPLIRDRLLHGGTAERRVVFHELKRVRARHLLVPDLEGVMGGDNPWHAELAVQAAAHVDPLLESPPSERVLLRGLTHALARVRMRAVYACDDLWRFTPAVTNAVADLARSGGGTVEEANAMATLCANLGDKGRHASGFLPLLTDVVLEGPSPLLRKSLKTVRTLRYEALQAAVEVDPRDPATRAACRAALRSDFVSLKLKALHGMMQVRDPTPDERAAVAAVMDDGDASVRAYASRLLRRPGWREE